VAPHALLALIDMGRAPVIVDVRTSAEFRRGHVPGAINAPVQTLTRVPAALAQAVPDEPLVVYCGHGPRAMMARALLHRLGFREVTLLEGHMAGWRRAGFRIEPPRTA
jgi:rhodanese-related sulfurtransferase